MAYYFKTTKTIITTILKGILMPRVRPARGGLGARARGAGAPPAPATGRPGRGPAAARAGGAPPGAARQRTPDGARRGVP